MMEKKTLKDLDLEVVTKLELSNLAKEHLKTMYRKKMTEYTNRELIWSGIAWINGILIIYNLIESNWNLLIISIVIQIIITIFWKKLTKIKTKKKRQRIIKTI